MCTLTDKEHAYIKGLIAGHSWYVWRICGGVPRTAPYYPGVCAAEWERGFKDGVEDAALIVEESCAREDRLHQRQGL